MPLVCPTCGEENSDTARFCQTCGSPMAPAAPPAEERKVVSVLFVDLVEFTSRSDQADPEDVRATLQPYHSRVKAEIESFGGIVEKFIGDAVMAVFGAPVSHGDDAERAVRAGLGVLDAIQELNRDHPGLDLTVRAAVNTGEAIVDARAQPDIAQGLAHGDVVNTASRLQTGAPPGALVVGEETHRATRTVIDYQPLDPIVAKGKREPLLAWQATGTLTAPAERAISAAPMVGRDHELDLLTSTWERATTDRRPHLVTVIGPPGIGKTRLTREFAAVVEGSGGRVVRGRSLPYGESSGYRAFAQQVKDISGIFETDSPQEARAKLDALVTKLCEGDEAVEIAEHVALLIGLGTNGTPGDRLPLFFSARRFVERLAERQHLLLVFEDIHWADPSQLDLLEALASRTRDAPVMFLALARPELFDSRPNWGSGPTGHTSVQLEPLEATDARALASQLLPALTGMQTAADRVVDTAEGNPLFIEELAASLAERMADATGELPTNVKTTIAARLDVLPPAARSILLDAAVIGKVFWRGALSAVQNGQSRELDEALDTLEARDFIRREPASQLQGDREYTFKHMLIREVAYATLPRAARRERHAAVARFIADAAGERIDEAAALLAHHWRQAGEDERAVEYLLMAAEHAGRGWAKDEAASLYAQAIELVPEERSELRRKIQVLQAQTLVELGDLTLGIPLLDQLLPELEGRDRLPALLTRGRAAFWSMDSATTHHIAGEATELAEKLGDREFLGPALSLRMHAASMAGDMEEAFALARRADVEWLEGSRPFDLAVHLNMLSLAHYWAGNYAQALTYGQRGEAMAAVVHSAEATMRSGSDLGMVLTGLGRHEEALAWFDKSIARGRELELAERWIARGINMLGGVYRELFDLDEARKRNEEAGELGLRAGFGMADIQAGIDMAFTDVLEGEIAQAEARMPGLWERAREAKGWHQWLIAGRLAEAGAEIALAKGDAEGAAAAAEESIREATTVPRLKYQTASRLVLGQALLRMKEHDRAVAELRTALAGADRLTHPPTLWRASLTLGRALAATGDDKGAADAFAKAAETVRAFAATLKPERADRLLAADPIREILAAV